MRWLSKSHTHTHHPSFFPNHCNAGCVHTIQQQYTRLLIPLKTSYSAEESNKWPEWQTVSSRTVEFPHGGTTMACAPRGPHFAPQMHMCSHGSGLLCGCVFANVGIEVICWWIMCWFWFLLYPFMFVFEIDLCCLVCCMLNGNIVFVQKFARCKFCRKHKRNFSL